MTAKELVKQYYEADLANETDIMDRFLHPDCTLNWHSSRGYSSLKYKDIKVLYNDIQKSYSTVRAKISHMMQEGDLVTTRYTLFVTPMETPDEEQAMAHFITIWEVRDNKLYKGFEISQLADSSEESLETF